MNDKFSLEILPNAIVSPMRTLTLASLSNPREHPGSFDGGVFYSDGSVCEAGIQLKAFYNNEPKKLESSTRISTVAGTHLFGGMLQARHFGHFLTESLSRLWAYPKLNRSIDSIVFYLRDIDEIIEPWVGDTLESFFPGVQMTIVRSDTRFDALIVPEQAIHREYKQILGYPLVKNALHSARSLYRGVRRNLYISRSKLHVRDGGILGEAHIENMLRREGYVIVHPEKITIQEQIDAYRTAGRIIFAEGSAIHLFALCATKHHQPFLIWRRKRNGVFEDQLKSFTGRPLPGSSRVRQLWIPEKAGANPVNARASVDMRGIEEDLRLHGFISDDVWDPYSENADVEEVQKLSDLRSDAYVPHPV